MKNILENLAVLFVGILSLTIVYLIVQYNMIGDESMEDVGAMIVSQKKVVNTKVKTTAYLHSLEGYGDDVDVKVNAKKEDYTNEVVVKSEISKDDLGAIMEDKSKSAYTQNLENYAKESSKEKLDTLKPVKDNLDEPEKLAKDEIKDEIGMAIDAALDDL